MARARVLYRPGPGVLLGLRNRLNVEHGVFPAHFAWMAECADENAALPVSVIDDHRPEGVRGDDDGIAPGRGVDDASPSPFGLRVEALGYKRHATNVVPRDHGMLGGLDLHGPGAAGRERLSVRASRRDVHQELIGADVHDGYQAATAGEPVQRTAVPHQGAQ